MRTLMRGSFIVCSLLLAACASSSTESSAQTAAPNTLTRAEQQAGWKLLFDGKTTSGWRGYMRDTMPSGWTVVDGVLARTARARDIITKDKYRNFELQLDWRLDPSVRGSNSGIFYLAVEGPQQIYYSAPELQILDDATHPDGRSRLTAAGSNYALHPAPEGVAKPLGEWNHVRLIVNNGRVQHWLNGTLTADYVLGSQEWTALVAKSKFNEMPEYGKAREGHIGLQEHGSYVGFRNIKIRVLP